MVRYVLFFALSLWQLREIEVSWMSIRLADQCCLYKTVFTSLEIRLEVVNIIPMFYIR